jgi:hypothetical protein
MRKQKYPEATKKISAPKYPFPFSMRERRKLNHIGSADGNIIVTIMASHINRNIAADAVQV